MPDFSAKSQRELATCHISLQFLFRKVVEEFDCAVLEGYRSLGRQQKLFDAKPQRTKLRPGKSRHNRNPSLAVDVVPYPVDWDDLERFYYFAGYVKGIAQGLGIKIRWGGDWSMDNDFKDQTFNDLTHYELEI